MTKEEFAARTEEIRIKLFRTAMIYHGRNGPHSPNTSGNGSHKAEKSPRTVKACPGRGKLRKGGKKWITEIELTSE